MGLHVRSVSLPDLLSKQFRLSACEDLRLPFQQSATRFHNTGEGVLFLDSHW